VTRARQDMCQQHRRRPRRGCKSFFGGGNLFMSHRHAFEVFQCHMWYAFFHAHQSTVENYCLAAIL